LPKEMRLAGTDGALAAAEWSLRKNSRREQKLRYQYIQPPRCGATVKTPPASRNRVTNTGLLASAAAAVSQGSAKKRAFPRVPTWVRLPRWRWCRRGRDRRSSRWSRIGGAAAASPGRSCRASSVSRTRGMSILCNASSSGHRSSATPLRTYSPSSTRWRPTAKFTWRTLLATAACSWQCRFELGGRRLSDPFGSIGFFPSCNRRRRSASSRRCSHQVSCFPFQDCGRRSSARR
jgi:hypothetical protein